MMKDGPSALALGIILLSALVANAAAESKQAVNLTLDPVPASVSHKDAVTFSGTLVDAATGEGIGGKPVTVYREGSLGVMPIDQVVTAANGVFSVEWVAELEFNRDTPVTVFAQFSGDAGTMSTKTTKQTLKITLIPIKLEITTDRGKLKYYLGEKATFTVKIYDGSGNFLDPDVIKPTYDGKFVTMKKADVGKYTFETPQLVRFEQHQFGAFVEKFGYVSAQKSMTMTVFGAEIKNPLRVTAAQQGDIVRILIKSNSLSPHVAYSFSGKLVGATVVDGSSAKNWKFSKSGDSFVFKSTSGAITAGKAMMFGVKYEGTPEKLVWQVFDEYGKRLVFGETAIKKVTLKK